MADIDAEVKGEPEVDGHAFSDAEIARRGLLALADRRARGEIMTYDLDGWVVREFPGMRIVRLCRSEDFRAEDYPYPSCPG
jgi:hypothetical protein